MPRLSLAVLGTPRICVDGAPVVLERHKAVALLAYLAITGRPHGREALAALLWPDLEPARASAGLRQTLWSLNSALGPGLIASGRAGVGLAPGADVELDAAQFRAHVEAARRAADPLADLRAAAARYAGPLLDGLELRDSDPFAEWRFFEAEALGRELAWVLEALAAALVARGDYEEAAAAARRRVALDPLHEPAHRALMQIYAAAGQRAAAVRQYDECARALREQLGVEPDAETIALFEEIRAGRGRAADRQLLHPSTPPLPGEQGQPASRSLPTPTTPFVGREEELGEIEALLGDPACRLLTLLGPGGIGKTRLAVEAAARLAPRFADGVCFVPLAPVGDPDLLLSAVADALGLDLFRREALRDQLLDFLRPRAMLLVADNLEQLAAGAPQLADLLEAAPGLRILCTSRERLGLLGEWALAVGGLTLPEGDAVDASAAVQLFVQGARRARGGRGPGAEDLPAVARICRLVGGAPLAIELAAAWARLMPYPAIEAALARDLDFLAGGARGLPERHRGLRAVFEHSWRLLDPPDQAALRRLAVFRGGFSLDAASAVLGAVGAAPHAALASLADRSLIRAVGPGRFDFHELVRQYAAERLAADPAEEAAAKDAHAASFLSLLRRSEGDLKGARQRAALDAIGADLDNVRAAWRRAVAAGSWAGLAAGLESLFLFYEIESLFEEGEDAFGRAAAAADAVPEPPVEVEILLANLAARQGWFALRLYRFEPARALFTWSLELIERHGPRRETLLSEFIANNPTATGGRLRSEARLREQIERMRAAGDRWALALALEAYAYTRPTRAEGQALLEESLAVSRAAGNRRGIASALDNLGSVAREGAQLRRAVAYWDEALSLYRELGYRWAYAYCLDTIGYARRQLGELDAAEGLHRESLTASRAIGDRLGIAGSLDNLSLVACDRGDLAEAERLGREALAIRAQVGHNSSTAISYLNLARTALARGDHAAARACLDHAQELVSFDGDWMHSRALRLRGRIAFAEGDLESAQMLLRTALDLVADSWALFDIVAFLGDLAQISLAAGARELAAELAAAALAHGPEIHQTRLQAEAVIQRVGVPQQLRALTDLLAATRV
jgi:predicted ATPase/DNA-binding SARP family transcriptional activator